MLCACLMCLLALASSGCVRRRLLIRSNPPGATVYVDNQPVGTTPCATSFVYYGTRKIRLVKAGYETLTVNQPIPAPWYEIPPLDFASENLTPREIQDYRTVSFNLTPQVVAPTDQLLARAEQLRAATLQGATPPGLAIPPGAGQLPNAAPPVGVYGPAAVYGPTVPWGAPVEMIPPGIPPTPPVPATPPGRSSLPPGGIQLPGSPTSVPNY